MKCCHCGGDLNPNGAWFVDQDRVCKQRYLDDTCPSPEWVFAGVALGVAAGVVLWVVALRWIAGWAGL